jgi:hypothetical protein
MRKFFGVALAVAGAFLFVPAAHAQFTTVTATVHDSNGIPYAGGTMSAVLVPGASGGYTLNGAPYSGQVGPVTLDSTGKFIANFGDVTMITPGSPQWRITINSPQGGIEAPLGTGGQTFTFTSTGTTISGSSPVDISTSLNALAPKMTNFAGSGSGTVTSISATSPIVATPNPIIATGTLSCPTCNTSSATIAGSIASGQIAVGSAPNTISGSADFQFTDVAGTQDIYVGGGIAGNLDIRVSSAVTHFFGPAAAGADTFDLNIHGTPFISATCTTCAADQSVTILQSGAGFGNFVFTSDTLTMNGATSGAAAIGIAAVAGTPCTILLPTTSATDGTFLKSAAPSGGSCQSTWDTLLVDNGTLLSYTGAGGIRTGPDGVHPGNISLVGNTTAVTPAANTFNIMGPSTAAFTAYALQFSSTAPTTGQCMVIGTVSAAVAPVNFQACSSGAALSAITAATGSNTIANGNNPQTWNWAQTTDAQDGMAFGETSAATGGTLTGFLANQALVSLSTATASTSTPLEIVQGSVTGTVAFPALQVETTWNNAGLTGQGIVENVTNTSSAAGSLLMNLLVGGTSQFTVDKVGNIQPAGYLTLPVAGAASLPALNMTGTPFSGTGTTSTPLFYQNGGAAPATWNTSGTYMGINSVSGFGGNFIDFHANGGASLLKVNSAGSLTTSGNITAGFQLFFTDSLANANGNKLISLTAPTIAAGGCGGAAASITANNGTAAFKIGVGTTPGSACTVTMPAATTGWNCAASDITTQSTTVSMQRQTGAESTTSVTITNFSDVTAPAAFVANDVLKVICMAD